MALECPNCRYPVSFWRSIRTTAWGRFQCKACGSVLGIDQKRRFVALVPWLACIAFFLFVAQVQRFGTGALMGAYLLSFFPIYYLLENVVLIERRSFCCRKCGYQLEGLTVPRCPECGQEFDPSEKAEVLERIGKPVPRARRRWVMILLVLLLLGTLVANLVTYYRVRFAPPPTPMQQPAG
ncbi:MAG TPA: hypothetical protein VM243_08050, partial [Phycisphaerae bacterium]|nr:hypothetical protein [Phycisphaerae bacterium]